MCYSYFSSSLLSLIDLLIIAGEARRFGSIECFCIEMERSSSTPHICNHRGAFPNDGVQGWPRKELTFCFYIVVIVNGG